MSYLINTLLHPLSIFLGVLLIFIGVISYYFNNKIKEQNLKIDSIANVVSTMAIKLHMITCGNTQNTNDKYINLNTSNLDNDLIDKHSLIHVSDSDESNSSDDDSHESYESEVDDYESDVSEESGDEDINDDKHKINTKILQHDYECLNIDENIIVLKIDTPFFNIENVDNIEENRQNEVTLHNEDNIIIELKEDNVIEKIDFENVIHEQSFDTEQLSQNNTIDLEKDNVEILSKSLDVDYKKMTLNKLKELALEKGLIDETSKLKKQDFLKLLSN
jgi:hypothetical protein